MAIYDINTQFNKVLELLNTDFIGVDNTLNSTSNKFFKYLNMIENRNIISTRPVLHKVCYGYYSDYWYDDGDYCTMEQVIDYVMENGDYVAKPRTETYISSNTWVNEITSFLKFDQIITKVNELKNITLTFSEKMEKSGMDYITQADMANSFVCNSIASMRGISNTFLTTIDNLLLCPTYTEEYYKLDENNYNHYYPADLIMIGLIGNGGVLNKPDNNLLELYISFLNNFIIKLATFLASASDDDKLFFLVGDEKDYTGKELFTLNYLKNNCTKFTNDIINFLNQRIELINGCLNIMTDYSTILKIVSTISIYYNTSAEANNIQRVLAQASYDNYAEVQIATNYAADSKYAYSQKDMAKGITLAIRKAVNHFNYYNKFETFLDLVFKQGIKQYDKITI